MRVDCADSTHALVCCWERPFLRLSGWSAHLLPHWYHGDESQLLEAYYFGQTCLSILSCGSACRPFEHAHHARTDIRMPFMHTCQTHPRHACEHTPSTPCTHTAPHHARVTSHCATHTHIAHHSQRLGRLKKSKNSQRPFIGKNPFGTLAC